MSARLPIFPRIPHLSGSCGTADDLWLSEREQAMLWRRPLVVLEKHDGINVAVACGAGTQLKVELRGGFHHFAGGDLEREAWFYLMQRRAAVQALLGPGDVLYGEWLKPRLTTCYTRLPDWLVVFALRRANGSLMPFPKLVRLARRVGLTLAEPLYVGRLTGLPALRALVGRSRFGAPHMEGLVVEPLRPATGPRYAKWVRVGFARQLPDAGLQLTNRLARNASCRKAVSVIPEP